MLSEVQRLLVIALHDEQPVERLRALVAEAGDGLAPDERAALDALDHDGLRLTSLIVRKLRFERVLRGDPAIAAEHLRDPAGVRARLRAYAAEMPSAFAFPSEEARAFNEYRRGSS